MQTPFLSALLLLPPPLPAPAVTLPRRLQTCLPSEVPKVDFMSPRLARFSSVPAPGGLWSPDYHCPPAFTPCSHAPPALSGLCPASPPFLVLLTVLPPPVCTHPQPTGLLRPRLPSLGSPPAWIGAVANLWVPVTAGLATLPDSPFTCPPSAAFLIIPGSSFRPLPLSSSLFTLPCLAPNR